MPDYQSCESVRNTLVVPSTIMNLASDLQQTISLPSDWKQQLCDELQNRKQDAAWYKLSDKLNNMSSYNLGFFKLIYARLTKQLDNVLDQLSEDEASNMANSLAEHLGDCIEGTCERAQRIATSMQIPRTKQELLCYARTDLVEQVIVGEASENNTGENLNNNTILYNVHHRNKVYEIAYDQGWCVKKPAKAYHSALSERFINSIAQKINEQFNQHYRLDTLIDLLLKAFVEHNLPKLKYNGRNQEGYKLGSYESFLAQLAELLEDEQLNNLSNGQHALEMDDAGRIVDIRWSYVRKRLWQQLCEQNLIIIPELNLDSVGQCPDELDKAKCYFLALAKNDPEQLSHFAEQLGSNLQKVVTQALDEVFIRDHDRLDLVLTNLNSLNDEAVNNYVSQYTNKLDVNKLPQGKVQTLLTALYSHLGEDQFKQWSMKQINSSGKLNIYNMLESFPAQIHEFMGHNLEQDFVITLLDNLPRQIDLSRHLDNNDNNIWHFLVKYYQGSVLKHALDNWSEQYPRLDSHNKQGDTVLHTAIQYNDQVKCQYLAEKKPFLLDWLNGQTDTIFHLAARFASKELMTFLLERCNNDFSIPFELVNANGNTPLEIAIQTNREVFCAEALLQQQTLLMSNINHGQNALHLAAKYGYDDMIQTIVDSADTQKLLDSCNIKDEQCNTVLSLAIQHQYKDLALQLFNRIVNSTDCESQHRHASLLLLPLNRGQIISLLAWAAEKGEKAVFEVVQQQSLLDKIKGYTTKVDHGEGVALVHKIVGSTSDVANEILGSFIDLDEKRSIFSWSWLKAVDQYNNTLLHHIASNKDQGQSLINKLEDKTIHIDASKRNRFGRTPLHEAARYGNHNVMVQLLRQPSASINCQDREGFTPLHYATLNGHAEIVKTLLEHPSIKPEIVNYEQGYPALLYACQAGYSQIVETFAQHSDFIKLIKKPNLPKGRFVLDYAFFRDGNHDEAIQTKKTNTIKVILKKLYELHSSNNSQLAGFCENYFARAISLTAVHGYTDLVDFIYSYYPQMINSRDSGNRTCLDLALLSEDSNEETAMAFLRKRAYSKCDILSHACNRGWEAVTKHILDTRYTNQQGGPIHTDAIYGCLYNLRSPAYAPIVSILVDQLFADEHQQQNELNLKVLEIAAKNGCFAQLERLLEHKKNNQDQSKLSSDVLPIVDYLVQYQKHNLLEQLFEFVHPDYYTQVLNKAFVKSAEYGKLDIFTDLCDNDSVDVFATNEKGHRVVRYLVKHNAVKEFEQVLDKISTRYDNPVNKQIELLAPQEYDNYRLMSRIFDKQNIDFMNVLQAYRLLGDFDDEISQDNVRRFLSEIYPGNWRPTKLIYDWLYDQEKYNTALALALYMDKDFKKKEILLDDDCFLDKARQDGNKDFFNQLSNHLVHKLDSFLKNGLIAYLVKCPCHNTPEIVESLMSSPRPVKPDLLEPINQVQHWSLMHILAQHDQPSAASLIDILARYDCEEDFYTSLNQGDAKGDTPLHIAVMNNCDKTVDKILEYNPNLNIRNKRSTQDTALHLAIAKGYDSIVEKILPKQKNLKITNGERQTPCQLAQDRGNPGIEALISRAITNRSTMTEFSANQRFWQHRQPQSRLSRCHQDQNDVSIGQNCHLGVEREQDIPNHLDTP